MTAALEKPRLLDPRTLEPSVLDEKQDWTVDDLASLPEDLRYELIDGRLILPSPTPIHQLLAVEVMLMLRPRCPAGYFPVIDLSLEVDRRNEPRPDVVVVHKAYAARTPVPVDGALLVVEVVSPTSHFRDLHAKWTVYASNEVTTYVVVDPTFKGGVVLTEFRLSDNGRYDTVTSTNKVFTTDVPYPITIDVPALTALRDEYSEAQQGA
ncbi:Uma2 family endonuclease [Actinoplanes sp. URMC 104]|uniref:Uma2 family endonuclease n=1 Tax=Actinoplanes sp. URMC 104 TaxID=3423409 RepID=UPI003F1C7D01